MDLHTKIRLFWGVGSTVAFTAENDENLSGYNYHYHYPVSLQFHDSPVQAKWLKSSGLFVTSEVR